MAWVVTAMDAPRRVPAPPLTTAMAASAIVGGQFVAAKATRDALFLTNFDVALLPAMIIGTAVFSILLVVASSNALGRISPSSWVPIGFGIIGVFILGTAALTLVAPGWAAVTLYLLVSGVGPVLVSGFWLIVIERFDPHTAKQVFGRIGGAGTLGGLLAGLGAGAVATVGGVAGLLPLVAGLNLACAWGAHRLARPLGAFRASDALPTGPAVGSGVRLVADTRYLRDLAGLVLVVTMAATFVDQAFMTHVKMTYGDGPGLGRFFSLYYASLSLLTFGIQMGGSRLILEKWGLGFAAGAPALATLAGGAAALWLPGLGSLTLLRAGEAMARASVHRSGYELSYTPLLPADRRAVKAVIDVGVNRLGDIVGALMILQLLSIPQPTQTTVLVSFAMGCAGVAVVVGHRLSRGYAEALARALRSHAVELDLSDAEDRTTRTAMLQTIQWRGSHQVRAPADAGEARPATPREVARDVQRILTLRSGDIEAIRGDLRSDEPLTAAQVAHVIPLLARDELSEDCVRALRAVVEERVGELVDALCDPNQPFAVRRRLARVFSVCVSQRAVDGLLLGLDDLRFEVRYQCGRSLLAVVDRNPALRVDEARIYALIDREVAVHKSVWQKRPLIDDAGDDGDRSFLEELVRDRANRSLAHVFTLLALVLPAEPLRLAFRALHTDDPNLRGTALEYLESVLPDPLRERLWPFLEDRRRPGRARRPRDETLAGLMQSRESIMMSLEKSKHGAVSTPEPERPAPRD